MKYSYENDTRYLGLKREVLGDVKLDAKVMRDFIKTFLSHEGYKQITNKVSDKIYIGIASKGMKGRCIFVACKVGYIEETPHGMEKIVLDRNHFIEESSSNILRHFDAIFSDLDERLKDDMFGSIVIGTRCVIDVLGDTVLNSGKVCLPYIQKGVDIDDYS